MNVALTPEAVDALTVAPRTRIRRQIESPQSLHNAEARRSRLLWPKTKREQASSMRRRNPQPRLRGSDVQQRADYRSDSSDANHKYPLKLALFAPISGYAVTLHTGKDRPERLVFWKVDDDKYQKVVLMEVRSGFRRNISRFRPASTQP